jgi:hypothetical protein
MEAAVRCLRDAVAPDETACCLVLVADDAHVDGEEGMETFSSLLREHADAAAAGRAHARRTVLVAGARAPRRHRLEPNAVSSLGGPPRKDGDALAVVDLTRDPHGWLASIGQKTRDANSSARKRAAPRLGDVASVAAAVHDALGGDVEGDDFGDEDEAGEGTHEYVVAETTARGAAEAPLRENKKSKDPNAQRERARSAVRFVGPRASRTRSNRGGSRLRRRARLRFRREKNARADRKHTRGPSRVRRGGLRARGRRRFRNRHFRGTRSIRHVGRDRFVRARFDAFKTRGVVRGRDRAASRG